MRLDSAWMFKATSGGFFCFVASLIFSDKIVREREGVESGVSAHHRRAEIRFSLITGFL